MTDTNVVDLTTLERGDEVVMGDGLKCFVTKCKEFQELFAVSLDPIDNDKCRFSSDLYFKNGISKTAGDLACNNIIRIIKNPKRWTDGDMRKAWLAGSDPMDWDGNVYETFKEWFEHYKQVNHEQ